MKGGEPADHKVLSPATLPSLPTLPTLPTLTACAAGLLTLAACAASLPPPIIEPPAQVERKTVARPVEADTEFVLSREGRTAAATTEFGPLHVGDYWWSFRAEYLNIGLSQAQTRDAYISESEAPANFWDEQTAFETVAIWGTLCNECHGGRRRTQDASRMPKPPAGWGRGEGLFFGNRRAYSEMFRTVYNGGLVRDGERSKMPPWRGKLAKEQIWSLIYFLEYQSGGIVGRFPPSLYPRGPTSEDGR